MPDKDSDTNAFNIYFGEHLNDAAQGGEPKPPGEPAAEEPWQFPPRAQVSATQIVERPKPPHQPSPAPSHAEPKPRSTPVGGLDIYQPPAIVPIAPSTPHGVSLKTVLLIVGGVVL